MTRLTDLQGTEQEDFLSRVYLAMIRLGNPTRELLEQEGFHSEDVRAAGSMLTGRGLVSEVATGRWEVEPPELALPRLAAQLEARARYSRTFASELGVIWRQSRSSTPEAEAAVAGVEALDSPDDTAAGMRSLEGMAAHRLEALVADTPAARVWFEASGQPAPGVPGTASREIVVDRDLLGEPGVLTELERQLAAGTRVQVMAGVPFGALVADGQVALVDFSAHDDRGGGSFVLRRAPVVAGLQGLVEVALARGVPLRPSSGDQPAGEDGSGLQLPERDVRILGLLASGATDQMIARSVGVSTRTVERRVRFLMEHLGGTTRFQAGVQAARRGWI